MIRWPLRSARAITKLFRSIQNIDIFVEDQGDERFYTLLFQKAAPDGVIVARVVALGGYRAVENAAAAYSDNRKALFLIDGDLRWVRGGAVPNLPRLYCLSCYCIENVLISEKLVSRVCSEEMMCDQASAAAALQMAAWRNSVATLVPLFGRFAVLNAVEPRVATVSEGINNLILADALHKLPRLCPQKVRSRIEAADRQIASVVGQDQAKLLVASVEARIAGMPDQLLSVSGKDFLLPLLYFHLKIVSNSRITKDQFRYRLASKADATDLSELRFALAVAG